MGAFVWGRGYHRSWSSECASQGPTYSNDTTARPAELRYCGNRDEAERLVPDFFTFTVRHSGERRQWARSAGWLEVTFTRRPSARCSSATAATHRMPIPRPW